MEYLNREILEEMRSEYGDTSIYRYIESRSDNELSRTKVSALYDEGVLAPIECNDSEYITDLTVYQYCHATNIDLYIKLLRDYDGPYIRPIWGKYTKKDSYPDVRD